jgi:hypothetical protein
MKKIIICTHGFSRDVYKVGSHHYAYQLSKLGYDVLVISTPISPFHLINLIKGAFRKRFLLKLKSCFDGVSKTEYQYREYIPFTFLPFSRGKLFNQKFLLQKQNKFIPFISTTLKRYGFNNIDFLIVENPVFSFMTEIIEFKKLYYRATDIYPEFTSSKTSSTEKQLVREANSVIVTSSALRKHLSKYRNGLSNIEVIENGVDSEFYLSSSKLELNNKELGNKLKEEKIQVVYVGALDDRIDFEIIKNISEVHRDHNFHFFGTVANSEFYSAIKGKANCLYWGPIDYKFLPQILKQCHVGLLPFIKNDINDSRSPMKLYEYGICGLTVLATRTADLEKKNEDFVILCSKDEFSNALTNRSLLKRPNSITAIHRSKLHSWENNTRTLIKIMDYA